MDPQTFQVSKAFQGKTLIEFLSESLEVSKNQAKRLLDARLVYVNNKRIWIAGHALALGDMVKVYGETKKSSAISVITKESILYQDDHYIVLNKPAGIISNGEKSAETHLRTLLKNRSLLAVHRLDKDTSGCLIFAANREAFDKAVETFRGKEVTKIYRVLSVGEYRGGDRTIREPIDGKEAISHVKCIKVLKELSLLEVQIETGRTHQIRKHLLSIGYPVLGDKEYVTKRSVSDRFRGVGRQMLHAYKIKMAHPYTDKPLSVTAQYPNDFSELAA